MSRRHTPSRRCKRARPDSRFTEHEPSPYVEAVADEPTPPPAADRRRSKRRLQPRPPANAPSWLDEPLRRTTRRHPLRFMWQMDADGRFSLGSDEFTRLIGARTAAGFGRLWSEIADDFRARSGGPRRQGGRHPRYLERHHLELAGRWRRPIAGGVVGLADLRSQRGILPAIAASGSAAISTAWRGLPRCAVMNSSAIRRRRSTFGRTSSADPGRTPPCRGSLPRNCLQCLIADSSSTPELPVPDAIETSHQTDLETSVETPKNVLPFRPIGEPKSPALTPVENSAFNELARQLSARLESEKTARPRHPAPSDTSRSRRRAAGGT